MTQPTPEQSRPLLDHIAERLCSRLGLPYERREDVYAALLEQDESLEIEFGMRFSQTMRQLRERRANREISHP